MKAFGAVDKLVKIVTGGVPVNAVATGADVEGAVQYGIHPSAKQPLTAVWKKIGEDVTRRKWSVIPGTRISCARSPLSISVPACGGRDTQGQDHK